VVKSINDPRLPTIKSKLAANKAVIEEIAFVDMPDMDRTKIGLKGSPTRVKRSYTPPKRESGIKIQEPSASTSVYKLMSNLLESKLV
jgi:electron transfer flavoprotein beta subunit